MTMQSDAADQDPRRPGTSSATPRFGVAAPHRLASAPARWSLGSLPGLFVVVGRRLWNHLALMLAIAAGFVVAVALVVSIPVYAEAVGYRVMRDELSRAEAGTRRPPFAFMYRYLGTQHGV